MNERIAELSAEAWRYANNYVGDDVMPQLRRYQEKFAELIIRECADIVNQPYDFKTPPDQKTYRYPLGRDEILKHFGFEK